MLLWVNFNMDYRAVADNNFERLWVHGPTTVAQNEAFDVNVQAWDYCERIVINYQNIVYLEDYIYNDTIKSLQLVNSSLTAPYQFTSSGISQGVIPGNYFPNGDNGNHKFLGISLSIPGIHYLKVVDSQGNSAFSNPIIVSATTPSYRIYWGDIHSHSSLSDGSGYPEEAYTYARDVALIDFASITDHDFVMELFDPMIVDTLYNVGDQYNNPGSFVTILAYEWTTVNILPGMETYGHINVYFKNNVNPGFFSSYDYSDPDTLWDALRQWQQANPSNDVITIPHHTSTANMNFYDWSYYDSELMPLVEVYSTHGSSEMTAEDGNPRPIQIPLWGERKDPGYHVQDALRMGYKVGMMCSSDCHDGHPGHSLHHTDYNMPAAYPYTVLDFFRRQLIQEGSLTAVMIEDLTRENVFAALQNRSCAGTTHVNRMFMNFSINGYPVGGNYRSELDQLGISTVNNISVFAAADYAYNISKIEIFRNSEVFCVLNSTGLYNTTDQIIARNGLGMVENLTLTAPNFNFTVTGTEYTGGLMQDGDYYITSNARKSLSGFNTSTPPSTNGIDYYYMRVIQEKPMGPNDIGWIGPIWVG